MDRPKWLLRLIYVRLAVFSVLIPVSYLIDNYKVVNPTDMTVLLSVVAGLSMLWWSLLRWNKSYAAQAYGQIAIDLLLITWTVNRTGGVDSYFSSLYFLEIVMSSILLERRGAFVAATASSVVNFAHMDLGYFGYIPSTTLVWPDLPSLQYVISLSIFGFCSVG